MNPAFAAGAALFAAYVASEYVARQVPARYHTPVGGPLMAGTAAAVLALIFTGLPGAWLTAVLTGVVATAAWFIEARAAKSAAAFVWIRLIAIAVITVIGRWLVPSVLEIDGTDSAALREAYFWPPGWYILLTVVAGGYVTVEWGRCWLERAIQPFAASVSFYEGADRGLPDGGRMIGRLERLLIYLFVLIDAPTAIGFLVTAKSILRFGEIKDRESHRLAEYIIIGTLMSFGFATLSAYLVRLIFGIDVPV